MSSPYPTVEPLHSTLFFSWTSPASSQSPLKLRMQVEARVELFLKLICKIDWVFLLVPCGSSTPFSYDLLV